MVFYTHARRDSIFKHVLATADAYVHRIAAGALPNEAPYIQLLRNLVKNGAGLSTAPFLFPPARRLCPRVERVGKRHTPSAEGARTAVAAAGVTPLSHPDVLLDFGSKETLARLQGRMKAAPDTQAYFSMAELRAMFPQMLATGERTLSVGDGDRWRVRPVQGAVGGVAPLDTMVQATNTSEYKASDEAQTLEQFMRECETHLQHGPIVDERRLETAQRNELVRVLFVNAMPVAVSALPPNGGEAKSEAMLAGPQGVATPHAYAALVDALLKDLPVMLQRLTIPALPLLWTADVWSGRMGGQPVWTLKALECNCIGFTHHLELAALVAREIVGQVAERKVALKRRVGVLEAVSSTDPPSAAGPFRKDTVPLCEALMSQGWAAEVAFYTPERKAAIVKHLAATVDTVVDRVAPGVLDDATDESYRALLAELAAAGVLCLPAPGKPLLHSENAVDGDFVDFSGKVCAAIAPAYSSPLDGAWCVCPRVFTAGMDGLEDASAMGALGGPRKADRRGCAGGTRAAHAGAYGGEQRAQLRHRCARWAKVSHVRSQGVPQEPLVIYIHIIANLPDGAGVRCDCLLASGASLCPRAYSNSSAQTHRLSSKSSCRRRRSASKWRCSWRTRPNGCTCLSRRPARPTRSNWCYRRGHPLPTTSAWRWRSSRHATATTTTTPARCR